MATQVNTLFDMAQWDACTLKDSGDKLAFLRLYGSLPPLPEGVIGPVGVGIDVNRTRPSSLVLVVPRIVEGEDEYHVFAQHMLLEKDGALWGRRDSLDEDPGELRMFGLDMLAKVKPPYKAFLRFDPWQGRHAAVHFQTKGISTAEVRRTVRGMSPQIKMVRELLREGRIVFHGCERLRQMASEAISVVDVDGHVFPRKDSPEKDIGGVFALLAAFSVYSGRQAAPSRPMDALLTERDRILADLLSWEDEWEASGHTLALLRPYDGYLAHLRSQRGGKV